eukprot:11339155-Alexandrium_andersonii.AAC.1
MKIPFLFELAPFLGGRKRTAPGASPGGLPPSRTPAGGASGASGLTGGLPPPRTPPTEQPRGAAYRPSSR